MASTFALGGFSLHGAAGAVAALIGFTGLAGGTGRYAAILLGQTKAEIERATAIAFFIGLTVGCLVLGLEVVA